METTPVSEPAHESKPHRGDPWHPEWVDDELESKSEERGEDPSWWRRLLNLKGQGLIASSSVKDVYASLESIESTEPTDDTESTD